MLFIENPQNSTEQEKLTESTEMNGGNDTGKNSSETNLSFSSFFWPLLFLFAFILAYRYIDYLRYKKKLYTQFAIEVDGDKGKLENYVNTSKKKNNK